MTIDRRIVPALAVLAALQAGPVLAAQEAVTPYPAAFFATSQPFSIMAPATQRSSLQIAGDGNPPTASSAVRR